MQKSICCVLNKIICALDRKIQQYQALFQFHKKYYFNKKIFILK